MRFPQSIPQRFNGGSKTAQLYRFQANSATNARYFAMMPISLLNNVNFTKKHLIIVSITALPS